MKRTTNIFLTAIVSCFASINILAQDTTRLSLLFAGDIMGHDSQIAAAYNATKGAYDYTSCYQFIKPYIASADVAIGNLELTLAGTPYKGYPAFSSPDALASTLKDVGFDVLVTANNHSCDRSKRGIIRTIEMLDSFKIEHTGTFVDEVTRLNDYPLMIERNGFKLALLNYTYGTNGIAVPAPTIVNLIDTTQISKDIAKAKTMKPDFIISFMHWGNEYESFASVYQKKITKYLFDKGVTLVIGAHPHVLQPMEYDSANQKLVVYSLGNFVSGQRDRYKNGGAMVKVELIKVNTNDSAASRIENVNYWLQYIHRDSKKQYYILPVSSFENDSTNFLKDEFAKQQFKTFVEDSRALLTKQGKNNQVKEGGVVVAIKPDEDN